MPLELEQSPLLGNRGGLRHLSDQFQDLAVGDVVPAWSGRNATQQVVRMLPPQALVYRSNRKHTVVSWAIILTPATTGCTRLHSRVRLGPIRHPRLVGLIGGLAGKLATGLMAAGLVERLVTEESASSG